MGGWALAVAASAFWSGILLAGSGPAEPGAVPWVMLGAGLLACGGLVVVRGYRRGSWSGIGRVALLVAGFVLLGAGWQGVHQDRIARSLLLRSGGRAIRVEGTLASDPHGASSAPKTLRNRPRVRAARQETTRSTMSCA